MNRLIATFLTLSVMALGVAATASADVVRVDLPTDPLWDTRQRHLEPG